MHAISSLGKQEFQLQLQRLSKKRVNKQKNKKTQKTRKPKEDGVIKNSPPKTTNIDGSGNIMKPTEDIVVTDISSDNNWTGNNISTLLSWLSNANYNIECLDLSIDDCSNTIRHNVVLGLMMSTGAGTISTANMGIQMDTRLKFILNIIFTVMTFIIAINTGRIKVYQIQERLEQFIKLKQEWTYFITTIAVEFQTPVTLRKDALQLILNNKEKYLDLMKRDCDFTEAAKHEMAKKIQKDTDQWFHLNKQFYNSHVSLLNFSKGIRINNLVDSMSYLEGMSLIQAEQSLGYDPNSNIAPFYDKVDRYKVIRHFYEIDMEEKRVKSRWEKMNQFLFPKYYENLREQKREEMYEKRKQRIQQEEEEYAQQRIQIYQKYLREKEILEMESYSSSEEEESKESNTINDETNDIENQKTNDVEHKKTIHFALPPQPNNNRTWFEYFSMFGSSD